VRITLFTVEDANRLLPELKQHLERLRALKREYDGRRRRVDVLGLAAAGASAENPDAKELGREQERLEALSHEMGMTVADAQKHGCLVKDLDQGLVDFYALNGDRLVFLCWKLGEPEVSHWHTLEGGYKERRPLQRSEFD
jgi:hypothetical protein